MFFVFKRLNRANSGQIDLREQEVLEGRRLRAVSFSACHSLPRWFTGLAAAGVARGSGRLLRRLATRHLGGQDAVFGQRRGKRGGGVQTFSMRGLTFNECLFNTRNVFRV